MDLSSVECRGTTGSLVMSDRTVTITSIEYFPRKLILFVSSVKDQFVDHECSPTDHGLNLSNYYEDQLCEGHVHRHTIIGKLLEGMCL